MSRIIIGLTGPTGAGKSLAAKAVGELGVQVIDCDILARRATDRGSVGLKRLCLEFGTDILNPDGTLDRKGLAAVAFSSKQNTERLNKTLLPVIAEMVMGEISAEYVLLDAPTLFESGIDSICDDTVAVLCDVETRRARIIERDRLTLQEANTRISAGKTDSFYIEHAGHILYNCGRPQDFKANALALFKKLYGGI